MAQDFNPSEKTVTIRLSERHAYALLAMLETNPCGPYSAYGSDTLAGSVYRVLKTQID